MPNDTINDDAFLQHICDKVQVLSNIFVCVQVAHTLEEEIKRVRRNAIRTTTIVENV